jgi:large subunit ribosomal protein L25
MKLKAKKREITGKKVKHARRLGSIPASVYGPKRKSENIEVDAKDFARIYEKVGHNKIFDLEIEVESKDSKVLVKDTYKNPIKDYFYTVGFYQIDEDSKITVEIPVEIIGESIAVKTNLGFLVTPFETITVYCLPRDIPSTVVVDISVLNNPGDTIPLSSLSLGEGVVLDSGIDANAVAAFIALPQKEIEEAPAPVVEGEVTAEGELSAQPAGETQENTK